MAPPQEEESSEAWNPVPVEVIDARRGDVARVLRASTTITGLRESMIQTEGAGIIMDLRADAGDRVADRDTLVQLGDDDSRLALAEAQRTLTRTRQERERTVELVDEGLVSRQLLDELDARLDSAASQVDRLSTRRRSLVVRAPYDGVITERLVGAAESVAPGQALFKIVDDSQLEASVQIPERELHRLRLGMEAQVLVDALGGRAFPAEVVGIDPFVDPRSGTIRVRLRLSLEAEPGATDDHADLRPLPGMFVQVQIPLELRQGVIVIPRRAVVREGERVVAYVLRDSNSRPAEVSSGPEQAWSVERVELSLGYEEGARVEVLEGLAVGDRVVEVGQVGLDPSALVHVVAGDSAGLAAPQDSDDDSDDSGAELE